MRRGDVPAQSNSHTQAGMKHHAESVVSNSQPDVNNDDRSFVPKLKGNIEYDGETFLLDYTRGLGVRSRSFKESVVAYFLAVFEGRPGIVPNILRVCLGLLACVYCIGLEVYLSLYNISIHGIPLRRRFKLPCPVICVGNLTTGGTGKTPLTQWVCRFLSAQGFKVVVLNRGYGGANEYGAAIVSDGTQLLLNSDEAGDEAYLLAQSLPGVPVIVGKDRRVTGMKAVERFHPEVILLDDGMQYWQLHKDLEIALLNSALPFDNGWTLPRGLLREPRHHLKRAGIVVLSNRNSVPKDALDLLRLDTERLASSSLTVTAAIVPVALRTLTSGENETSTIVPLEWLQNRRIVSLCGLGNPTSFETTLGELMSDLVGRVRLRDHEAVTETVWQDVAELVAQSEAVAIVTTEKDAVKMTGGQIKSSVPIYVLSIAMDIQPSEEFERALLRYVTRDRNV